ncbi:MAG: hypothetical protein QNJ32_04130 [Xenococcaceae cyanobacterium MO_167.B27]|nr:hypothetical protein [Xenococcaceae cyanobacterium MO_167.B27]
MARSKYDWTQVKFERYIKEGRGKGSGKNYKPWITIQDFPSKGRVSRSPGWKSDQLRCCAPRTAFTILCQTGN